jgi:NADH-ubiquinone oxidoreductase chain 5
MYLLIIFLPLISAIFCGLGGHFLGKNGAIRLSITCLTLTTILSGIAFYEVGLLGSPCYIKTITWIDSGLFHIDWGFLFDSLTVVMLMVVTIVSTLVHIYSSGYMSEDPHVPRFMSYLSLFTFFMLILVTADNFIQLFLGWEGVGLCSYLLISFWYTRIQANKAAIKAMIMNRIGDFGLSLGIMLIFYVFKSLDFTTVFTLVPFFAKKTVLFFNTEIHLLTTICLLLFIGAIGKSAQIGLHTWLPDAMEGPTPVSALIHAATMVTAGVFLIIRCSPIFEYAPTALLIITFLGALTAFFAATTGMLQNDLKKVIAYSTCSQLGYMVFACGLSNYHVSLFHLANHAFFKALLFLGAGSVIHAMSDEQDMRKMGGLIKLLPFTYSIMLIGSLALMGFPFLTGFYSKDVILELAYSKYTFTGTFAHWLGTISAFFTAFYSFRLVYLTFLSTPNGYKNSYEHVHEAPISMKIPLVVLSFGSIFIGYLTRDFMIGLGSDFFLNAIFIHPVNLISIDSEFIPYYIKLVPTIFSLIGAFLALLLNIQYTKIVADLTLNKFTTIYTFFNQKWFFDKIYNNLIASKTLNIGYNTTFKTLDKGFIELFGPQGLTDSIYILAKNTSKAHSGHIYNYACLMLLGVIFLIGLIEFKLI